MAKTPTKQLVVCIDNEGYAVSLEKRKIYIASRCRCRETRPASDRRYAEATGKKLRIELAG
jgi:hypothetical protein